MTDEGRAWVNLLTVSRTDTAQREMARRALDAYFARTSSARAVRNFLDFAVGATPRQKRILADLIAPYVSLGEPWRNLLFASHASWARRAVRARLALWDDATARESLYLASAFATVALQVRNEPQCLTFLVELTIETLSDRPTVALRPVERWLRSELKLARSTRGWKRKLPEWYGVLEDSHARIAAALAPPDAPLPTDAPPIRADGLPVPAKSAELNRRELPLPATPGKVKASASWRERWRRFFTKSDT